MKFCQWASILTQRLALYLLSAWGQKGWGHLLSARGLGVIGRPQGGGGSAARGGGGGHWLPWLSCQHWIWEGWWSGTITKMVKGIASWDFPKEQPLVEDKPEYGTQKYSKCQTPPIWKKQVARPLTYKYVQGAQKSFFSEWSLVSKNNIFNGGWAVQ